MAGLAKACFYFIQIALVVVPSAVAFVFVRNIFLRTVPHAMFLNAALLIVPGFCALCVGSAVIGFLRR